jgi:O-antigen/teichoic acid export membrane protein
MTPAGTVHSSRRVMEAFGVVGGAQLLIRLRGILLIPVLARGLGAHDYGIWVLAVGAISLVSIVTMLGMPQGLERFLPGTRGHKDQREQFLSALVLATVSTAFAAAVAIASAQAVGWFGQASLAPLFRVGGWLLLATALNQVALMYFRSQREMRTLAAFDVATGLGELVLSALAVRAGLGLYGALLALLAARAATAGTALGLIARRLGLAVPRFVHMRAYLLFSLPTIMIGLMYWVIETSDRYFVGFYGTPVQVGVYSAAYTLGSVLVFIRAPFMFVLPPFMYQLWDGNDRRTAARYLDVSLLSYLGIGIPTAVGVSMLSRPVLVILAGREFAMQGGGVVPIVVAAMFCYGVSGITGLVFWLEKRSHTLSLIWGLAAASNGALNFVLIPRWGIVGAAVATFISYAIPLVPCVAAYHRVVRQAPDVSFLSAALLASIFMGVLVRLLHPSGIAGIATAAGVGVCAYVGSLMALQGRRLVGLCSSSGAVRDVLAARRTANG